MHCTVAPCEYGWKERVASLCNEHERHKDGDGEDGADVDIRWQNQGDYIAGLGYALCAMDSDWAASLRIVWEKMIP